MERALKVVTLDIKRKRFIRDLIFSLVGLTGFSFLTYFILTLIDKESKITITPTVFLSYIPYIILVITSFSLTQEYSNKTDKMVFTGVFTRIEIMVSKLSSFIITSIICFLFYEVISMVCGTFNLNLLFNNFLAFLIYAFMIGAFLLLISVITSNFIITGIVGYVLYFDLMLALLNQALTSNRSEVLKKVIPKLPFYIANTGFKLGNYTVEQAVIMIGCGMLFFGTACVIINRKSM